MYFKGAMAFGLWEEEANFSEVWDPCSAGGRATEGPSLDCGKPAQEAK